MSAQEEHYARNMHVRQIILLHSKTNVHSLAAPTPYSAVTFLFENTNLSVLSTTCNENRHSHHYYPNFSLVQFGSYFNLLLIFSMHVILHSLYLKSMNTVDLFLLQVKIKINSVSNISY